VIPFSKVSLLIDSMAWSKSWSKNWPHCITFENDNKNLFVKQMFYQLTFSAELWQPCALSAFFDFAYIKLLISATLYSSSLS
jgi:hypothetical protein